MKIYFKTKDSDPWTKEKCLDKFLDLFEFERTGIMQYSDLNITIDFKLYFAGFNIIIIDVKSFINMPGLHVKYLGNIKQIFDCKNRIFIDGCRDYFFRSV